MKRGMCKSCDKGIHVHQRYTKFITIHPCIMQGLHSSQTPSFIEKFLSIILRVPVINDLK